MARTRLAAGRRPLKAKRMPLSLGVQPVAGGLLHELADQLVHVQVAQPHGDADDLGRASRTLLITS
jgi:hypothetical protein